MRVFFWSLDLLKSNSLKICVTWTHLSLSLYIYIYIFLFLFSFFWGEKSAPSGNFNHQVIFFFLPLKYRTWWILEYTRISYYHREFFIFFIFFMYIILSSSSKMDESYWTYIFEDPQYQTSHKLAITKPSLNNENPG